MHKLCCILILCALTAAATALAGQEMPLQQTIVPIWVPSSESAPLQMNLTELEGYLAELKAERDALTAEGQAVKQQWSNGLSLESPETTKLRIQLGVLIKQLDSPRYEVKKSPLSPSLIPTPSPNDHSKPLETVTPKDAPTKSPKAEPKVDASKPALLADFHTETPADPLSLAHVLLKAGKTDLALKAYKMVDTAGMRADERAPVQYLMASCLRRLGKLDEAAGLYREAANARGDEQVAACAQWQLAQLRWRGEFEAQLKELRERRKALEINP